MSDLIIRDATTGESRSFVPTSEGYAAADAYRQSILEQGHHVGDDNSGSMGRIGSFFGGNGNTGRSGKPSWW